MPMTTGWGPGWNTGGHAPSWALRGGGQRPTLQATAVSDDTRPTGDSATGASSRFPPKPGTEIVATGNKG